MSMEHLLEKERYEVLAEMADMYYNQGKTQSEIAQYFGTNRFRVAKLLQDARAEQVVEINIHYSNERNKALEKEMKEAFGLEKALVVNTQYIPYIDSLKQIGKIGANYLARLLTPDSVIGLTWGKTIHSVVSQLAAPARNPVMAVQLTGYPSLGNPAVDPIELVRMVATSYSGSFHYLMTPIYVSDPKLRRDLLKEPAIQTALKQTERMDVVLSGIGGRSSLPLFNPAVQPYLTEQDREAAAESIGSLYGYVLDKSGNVADIDLNKKVMAAELDHVLAVPHRLVVACGRHKAEVMQLAMERGLFNEVLTDADTAVNILKRKG